MSANQQNKIEIILSAVDHGLNAGIKGAVAGLKSLFSQSKRTESGLSGMGRTVEGVLASIGATVSAAAGLTKLVSVTREFDVINAGLITSTGSAEQAAAAFTALQDFAAKTPYDLAQVSEAFVKLVNMGLDPSERAIASYGNTSASMGKDLNQMIEAVADAATGEFERLKEFGIKASTEGDKVSFSFRGVTTTVGKNAKEIEEYLIKLGETNFGDAMANRMKTLDGALSNLGDEWNDVFLNISRAGIGDIIAEGVRVAIGALEELNAMIKSGELEGYLRAIGISFSGWGEDVKSTIDIVGGWWKDFTVYLGDKWKPAIDGLSSALEDFPENVRALVGIATVYVAASFDKMKARANDFKEWFKANFTNFQSTWVKGGITKENEIIDKAREASIDAILKERDATIKASEDKRTKAKLERIAYEEKERARKAADAGVLGQSRIQTAASQSATKSSKEEGKAKREAAASAKKAATEAKKEYEDQKKIAAEKLRYSSQEKILAMELEKIEADKLPTELARAEAILDIERRISAEKISLKKQEITAMKEDAARPDSNTSQADIIRAQSELAAMQVDAVRQEHNNLATVTSDRLAEVEQAWRRGQVSVEQYRQAVQAAGREGVITANEMRERMIASGDDMGAALSLGFQRAKEQMQTDAEVMIDIGQNLGNQVAGDLTSAWDSYIDRTKTAKEALIDFARSTLSWLSQIILKQMLLNAIGTGSTTDAKGVVTAGTGLLGAIGLADGGSVPGWSPSKTSDNIPAWLTAREFVQPVSAVDHYGNVFMEAVRTRKFPRHIARALAGETIPRIPTGVRLAGGGQAAAPAQAAGQPSFKGGDTYLKVVNLMDKALLGDLIKSTEGETLLINFMRRNGSIIKAIAR